jgi:hypothetical protein
MYCTNSDTCNALRRKGIKTVTLEMKYSNVRRMIFTVDILYQQSACKSRNAGLADITSESENTWIQKTFSGNCIRYYVQILAHIKDIGMISVEAFYDIFKGV